MALNEHLIFRLTEYFQNNIINIAVRFFITKCLLNLKQLVLWKVISDNLLEINYFRICALIYGEGMCESVPISAHIFKARSSEDYRIARKKCKIQSVDTLT